jgi:hypothetical protein
MNYYILDPGDTSDDVIKDTNQLGEDNGFGVFWAGSGYRILSKLINEQHDIVKHFSIMTDRGKHITVEEFLDKISKLKIRIPS